jgi:hypothetical protein
MKKLFLGILLSLTIGNVNAQALEKGDNLINIGFGIDPYYNYYKGPGYRRTAVGPVTLSYEHILTDVLGVGRIGVGGLVGQSFYTTKYYDGNYYDYKYRTIRTAIIARAAYHFDIPVKGLDLYAGLGFGAYINSHREWKKHHGIHDYENRWSSANFAFSIYGGVRYFFNDNVGIFAEFGYGISALNAGISFKF